MPEILNYQEFGQGQQSIIILHGLLGSSSNFKTIASHLANDYKVYTPDLRNHGHSPWADSMSYLDMASDVALFIEQHEIVKPHIIGHSMGGKVAMALALNHAKHVNKLIVADIAPVNYSHGDEHQKFIDAMLVMDLQKINQTRKNAEIWLKEKLSEPTPVIQFLLQNLIIKNQTSRWRVNLPILKQQLAVILANDITDSTSHYLGNALFIHGLLSDYVLPEHHNKIKSFFPNAEIIGLENAGHWLHVEQRQAFLHNIINFLD